MSWLSWVMKYLRMMGTLTWCLECVSPSSEQHMCTHLILSATLAVLLLSLFYHWGNWDKEQLMSRITQPEVHRTLQKVDVVKYHTPICFSFSVSWDQEHFWTITPNLCFHVAEDCIFCLAVSLKNGHKLWLKLCWAVCRYV